MFTLYRYANLSEFLEAADSSRDLNFEAILIAADKMPIITHSTFEKLLHKICDSSMSIEDFFDAADECMSGDKYETIKREVLTTPLVDPVDMLVSTDNKGLGIQKIEF